MAFGTQELVIVLVAFFILFGAERLPKLARSMGQAKGEFQNLPELGPQRPSALIFNRESITKGGLAVVCPRRASSI